MKDQRGAVRGIGKGNRWKGRKRTGKERKTQTTEEMKVGEEQRKREWNGRKGKRGKERSD